MPLLGTAAPDLVGLTTALYSHVLGWTRTERLPLDAWGEAISCARCKHTGRRGWWRNPEAARGSRDDAFQCQHMLATLTGVWDSGKAVCDAMRARGFGAVLREQADGWAAVFLPLAPAEDRPFAVTGCATMAEALGRAALLAVAPAGRDLAADGAATVRAEAEREAAADQRLMQGVLARLGGRTAGGRDAAAMP